MANLASGFSLIAPSVWEYTPPSTNLPTWFSSTDLHAPSLVLICTWTGARPRHIAKYTTKYQTLFPSSLIMVVTTTAKDLCFRSSERKQERMKPAVERLSSYKSISGSTHDNGILLHVFSEGGSNKACELAEAYYNITQTRIPVSAMCLDSTPGRPHYLRLCKALNKSLPQVPILRHASLLLASGVLGCIWFFYKHIKGPENNVITRTRRRLQDDRYLDSAAPRCYLFSKNDNLIAWKDVGEHAEEARAAGSSVTDVLFEVSGHVDHAKQEPRRYWDAVVTTWNKAGWKEKQIPHSSMPKDDFTMKTTLQLDICRESWGGLVGETMTLSC
ncbi:indole-diterpene biosynthesis protein [Stemphylium lycopersici]|uniref:Indole-diterpene biosynthesis protein n=1 Tax=Stemphylium lycopersici TaxID=183478 RepID=A0A364N8V8_STELY|nr:indole-diterpene biosynthesis protein [Stemphylium lycopersici]RAR13739.1 indole-diterpene biosynthesis protein [Stemphylium lycopersici]